MKYFQFLLIITCYCQTLNAQDKTNSDPDKLLSYYQTHRYDEAVNYLRGVYSDSTEDPKELSQLAYSSLMAGQYAQAEKSYLKLHAQNASDLPVLFNLAVINAKRGNHTKAENYYKQILKVDSNNFMAYKQLALLNNSNSAKDKIQALVKANGLNPKDPDVAFELSEVFIQKDSFQRAKMVLDTALNADSANLRLMKLKIPISIAEKKYSEAITVGDYLLQSGDSSAYTLNNVAKAHFLSMDYHNALKYFLMIPQTEDETLMYHIGMSYRGIKDYKNAATYLEKAIKQGISSKTATYYGLLGDSYEMTGKNEDATRVYKKGLLFENNGSLFYNIALLYETKLNDKKNAVSYYEQYLKTLDEKQQPKQVIFIKRKIDELKK